MLTAELIVDSHFPSEPALSPDGKWVAYQVSTITKGVPEVWLAAVDGSEKPRKLTEGSLPRWSRDALYFLRDGRVFSGDEELFAWRSEITGFLPLHDRIVFIAEDETPAPAVWVWSESLRPARLRSFDPRTGEIRTLVEDAVARRPDDGALAVVTWPTPEVDPGGLQPRLSVLDLENGERRDLGRVAFEADSPVWWRDEDDWHIAYLGTPEPVGGWAVFDVPVETGEHRNLTEESTCPIKLAQVDSGAPLVLVADGLDTALHRLGSGEVSFWRGQADALASNGEIVVTVLSTAHRPKDVHCGPLGGALTRVSDTAPEFSGISWGSQERLSYQASDGLALDGLLVLPPGKKGHGHEFAARVSRDG